MRKKIAIIIAFCVAFWGLQSGGFAATTINYARSFYGTLPMDPHQPGNAGRYDNLNQVYDTPVWANKEGKIIPNLAESWKISKDFKEYTFVIRKGIKFHDGTPLNAEAVKFSFDRIVGIGTHAVAQWRTLAKDGAKVEAESEYVLKFTFPEPAPIFLRELIYACYGVVSPTYVKKYATEKDPWATERMAYDACGTGPFKFVSHEAKQRIVLEKNTDYWAGKNGVVKEGKRAAQYDRLLLTVVPDPTTRRIMLEKGEIDIAKDFPNDTLIDLKKAPGVKVEIFPFLQPCYIMINCSKKPFDNAKVRQAMAYAIDYNSIINDIERGFVVPMHGLIPKGMMGYDTKRFTYKRDITKAKKLMTEAGYANGFSTSLIYAPERKTEYEQEAVLIQSYLKEIGIDVKIEKMAYSAQLSRHVEGAHELSLTSFASGTGDPSVLLNLYLPPGTPLASPQYSFRWKNEKASELLQKGITIPDGPARAKLYADVDEMAMKEAVVIPLYQISLVFAYRSNVSGFQYDTMRRAVLWEAVKK